MFRYFSKAWDRYQLPIYPIAVFSFAGRKVQPQSYSLELHDLAVLNFRFRTVQLNQLDWSTYVKLQCLRLLATLRLDVDKSKLISHFVSSYLRLNPREMRVYEENLESIPLGERQAVMQITNEWIEKGRLEGRSEGRLALEKASRRGLKSFLDLKFGEAASTLIGRLPDLGVDVLESLQDALEAGADLQQLEKLVP